MKDVLRILVIRGGGIGDMILTIPALRALRRVADNLHVTLLTNWPASSTSSPVTVLTRLTLVDSVVTLPYSNSRHLRSLLALIRSLPRLRASSFDVIVCLRHSVRSRISQMLESFVFRRLVAPKVAIGFRVASQLHNLTTQEGSPIRMRQEAERLVAVLASEGLDFVSAGLYEPANPSSTTEIDSVAELLDGPGTKGVPWVAVCPFAKEAKKAWPLSRYEAVCRRLDSCLGCRFVIVGGEHDRSRGDRFARTLGDGVINTCGELSIIEVCELLSRCRFYLGNDTGPMHLAALVGTPCVAIFSAHNNPGKFYPVGTNHKISRKSVSCEGCLHAKCKYLQPLCMNAVSVEEVYENCLEIGFSA